MKENFQEAIGLSQLFLNSTTRNNYFYLHKLNIVQNVFTILQHSRLLAFVSPFDARIIVNGIKYLNARKLNKKCNSLNIYRHI